MVTHFIGYYEVKLFCTPNRGTTYSCGAALSHTVQQDHDRPQGEENYHHSYWCKCLSTLARPGWTYSVALDLHKSSLYSLTIPNLGLRCTNIPTQYPMLVLQRPCHTNEPCRSDDNPGGAILTPRFQAKICSDCHGLTIKTRLTIKHAYQCATFQSLVACASGWEAMAQRGVAARKMSEYFCARRHPQVGFLVRFGFTTKWISWN